MTKQVYSCWLGRVTFIDLYKKTTYARGLRFLPRRCSQFELRHNSSSGSQSTLYTIRYTLFYRITIESLDKIITAALWFSSFSMNNKLLYKYYYQLHHIVFMVGSNICGARYGTWLAVCLLYFYKWCHLHSININFLNAWLNIDIVTRHTACIPTDAECGLLEIFPFS